MFNKEYYSTAELAKILSVSRITIFNRIKAKQIKAKKIGRNYIIAKTDIASLLSGEVSKSNEQILNRAIKKTVSDYGETLKLLGAE